MRILLVNDDGIFAAGLAALRQAVEDLGEATVVAPEKPQSAAGRSITLGAPIACRRVHRDGAFWGIAVAGRPADCVKLAVRELMDAPPDLVLAGINAGANVGVNVFYSGTVAAAAEGALFGIRSVSFSLAMGVRGISESDAPPAAGAKDFRRAARLCRWVLDGLMAGPMQPGELFNVNIPPLSASAPRGVKVVPQSAAAISETYVREDDASGDMRFRLTDEYNHDRQDGETDVTALESGFIAVTPLCCDLTDRVRLGPLRQRAWGSVPP